MASHQAKRAAGKSAGGSAKCANCERLRRALRACQQDLKQFQERDAERQAQLLEYQRSQFGRKNEAAAPGADEAAGEDSPGDKPPPGAEPKAHGPQRKKRGRQPGSPTPAREKRPHLPRVLERRDVPEQDRQCPSCGSA